MSSDLEKPEGNQENFSIKGLVIGSMENKFNNFASIRMVDECTLCRTCLGKGKLNKKKCGECFGTGHKSPKYPWEIIKNAFLYKVKNNFSRIFKKRKNEKLKEKLLEEDECVNNSGSNVCHCCCCCCCQDLVSGESNL